MKNYINGFIWGLKISIKIMARCKDINKSIMNRIDEEPVENAPVPEEESTEEKGE